MKNAFLWVIPLLLSFCGLLSAASGDNPHGDQVLTCEICHSTDVWSKIHYSHAATGFVIEFAHRDVACTGCHDLKDFSSASRECAGCHTDVHKSEMGQDCSRCHTPRRWEALDSEEIHTRTRLPMLSRHNLIACLNCHPNLQEGDFAGGTTTCVDCHEQDYLATENPRHVTLGFGTECLDCHEMIGWHPAFFAGHDVIFPVFSGVHRGVWNSCADCHPDPGDYQVFSCFKCHPEGPTNGEHAGIAGYRYNSEGCLTCHPTGSKEGGVSNHDADFFPIFSGTHASSWESCSDCHTVSGDFGSFSCTGCHEHDQSVMDSRHGGITGYAYDSSMCYSCHPRGEKGEFREHDSLYFPIYTGSHRGQWSECADCHRDPGDWTSFSCIDCHAHSRDRMDSEHQEVPDYMYDSDACHHCHSGRGEIRSWKRPPSRR